MKISTPQSVTSAVAGIFTLAAILLSTEPGVSQQEAAPPNDDFSHRIALAGSSITTTGSNWAATRETGEPIIAATQTGKSVWWSWNAPDSGRLVVSTMRSSFQPVLAAFTGHAFPLTNLAAQTINDPFYGETGIVFDVRTGQEYQIAIDGKNGSSGSIVLTCQFFQQHPLNDDFSGRLKLTGTEIRVVGHKIGASLEPGEPSHECFGSSVWWSWTAPGTYLVDASVFPDPSYNAQTLCPFFCLNIYTGVPPLTRVQSYRIGTATSVGCRKLFLARAGETYSFAVDGIEGVFPLSLSCYYHAQNDAFRNTNELRGTRTTRNTFNHFATHEPGEPAHAGIPPNRSLWWSWTAPAVSGAGSRPVTFTTFPSDFNSLLAVYTGDALTNLTLIAENNGAQPSLEFSEASFVPTPGRTYHVAVDSANSTDVGYVTLSLDYSPIHAVISDLQITSNFTAKTVFFRASLNVTNYRATTPRPLRARLVRHAFRCGTNLSNGQLAWTEVLAEFLFPPMEFQSSGSGARIPIEGTCPAPNSLAELNALWVVIDEESSGTWLPVGQVFVLLGFNRGTGCVPPALGIGVLRAANVVEGRSGPVEVADLAIVGPGVITSEKTTNMSVLALMTGNAPPALVADPAWIVPPILSLRTNMPGTNFFLTAGTVCAPTNVTISCTFEFLGSEFEATKNLTLLPLPFALQASLLSSNHSVLLRLTGPPTNRYVIEATDALGPAAVWQRFWTNPANGDCSWLLSPTNQALQKYFRGRKLP